MVTVKTACSNIQDYKHAYKTDRLPHDTIHGCKKYKPWDTNTIHEIQV